MYFQTNPDLSQLKSSRDVMRVRYGSVTYQSLFGEVIRCDRRCKHDLRNSGLRDTHSVSKSFGRREKLSDSAKELITFLECWRECEQRCQCVCLWVRGKAAMGGPVA